MKQLTELFSTKIYCSPLKGQTAQKWLKDLEQEIAILQDVDHDGQIWSQKNYPNGFTSYASENHLHRTSPNFGWLEKQIDKHVQRFAQELHWDLQGGKLQMSNCWVNVMPVGAHHSLHLHPLSVVSGTFYLKVPSKAAPIKFEDPRLSKFMATPPRKSRVPKDMQNFYTHIARAGDILLFESWLRHEVPMNSSPKPRISISFNYDWV